jgi:hypothetical protein
MGNAESGNGAHTDEIVPTDLFHGRVIDPQTYWEELVNAVENNDHETIQIIASTEGTDTFFNLSPFQYIWIVWTSHHRWIHINLYSLTVSYQRLTRLCESSLFSTFSFFECF